MGAVEQVKVGFIKLDMPCCEARECENIARYEVVFFDMNDMGLGIRKRACLKHRKMFKTMGGVVLSCFSFTEEEKKVLYREMDKGEKNG